MLMASSFGESSSFLLEKPKRVATEAKTMMIFVIIVFMVGVSILKTTNWVNMLSCENIFFEKNRKTEKIYFLRQ